MSLIEIVKHAPDHVYTLTGKQSKLAPIPPPHHDDASQQAKNIIKLMEPAPTVSVQCPLTPPPAPSS